MGLIFGPPDLFGFCRAIACGDGLVTVRAIAKEVADDLVRHGHYSRSVVWSSSEHFGVYVDEELIGVIQYGPGMNPASGSRVVAGTTPGNWLELNRMWLADVKPPNCASRAIAYSLRLLRHSRPNIEWIQTFADERCGKLGAVYQAASFLYLGCHSSTFYELDGEWYHKSMKGRALVDRRGWRAGPKITYFRAHASRAIPRTFLQYRYIKFFSHDARRRLLLTPQPYPKTTQLIEVPA
jgi:hypothetical protein